MRLENGVEIITPTKRKLSKEAKRREEQGGRIRAFNKFTGTIFIVVSLPIGRKVKYFHNLFTKHL